MLNSSSLRKIKLVGLDTNLFVYLYQRHPQFLEPVKSVFEKIEKSQLKGVTSIITIAELLSYPLTKKVADEICESFFTTPNLRIVDVDREICSEAARIRQSYRFFLPDAIQLATAKFNKAQAFITNDKRLKKFKELKIILLNQT